MPPRPPKVARRQFVDVAWQLGCSGGYDAVKIRAIAEALGVSGALLYTYFEDKASLMDELRVIGNEQLDAALARALDVQDPRTAILRLCREYVGHMREHAWLYRGDSKLELHGAEAAHADAFIGRAAVVLSSTRPGHPETPSALALHLWLALTGVMTAGRGGVTGFDDGFVARHVEMIVRGILAELPAETVQSRAVTRPD